jgi:hypothetical protein
MNECDAGDDVDDDDDDDHSFVSNRTEFILISYVLYAPYIYNYIYIYILSQCDPT